MGMGGREPLGGLERRRRAESGRTDGLGRTWADVAAEAELVQHALTQQPACELTPYWQAGAGRSRPWPRSISD